MKFIQWLANIDRRIIFLVIAAAVIVPLLLPLGMPVKVTPQAQAIYDEVDGLPPGSTIVMAFDYDPAASPEVHPMALAILHHCFEKKHNVIVLTLWAPGVQLSVAALDEVSAEYALEYGRDYVNLGYKTGAAIAIKALGTSFADVFPADLAGRSTATLPLMKKVNNLTDVDLIVDLSAGFPGIVEWVLVANGLYQKKIAGGCTAVSAPQFFPYLQTGQLIGLLGGLKGAAEYEALVERPGRATSRMDSQSIAHLVIIIFIIFANVSYFVLRRRGGGKREGPAAAPPESS